jgi:hypothetical protein
MAEQITICLIGPKKGGKSALLASAIDCVLQGAHGYPSDLRPAMRAISQAEFENFNSSPVRSEFLDSDAEEYQRLRREFAEGGAPTDARRVLKYFFRLTINGVAPTNDFKHTPYLVKIIDAGGDIAIPDDNDTPIDIPIEEIEAFYNILLAVDAIVLVMPLVRLEDSGWIAGVSRLFDRLANAPGKSLKRVVVALSHYERIFVRLGPSAFTYACDPAVARYVLRHSLKTARWMDSLRSLESGMDGVKVRFTVSSSYGFTKNFQNPNIDPHQSGEKRFRRSGVAGPRAFNEFWRPFLTADPILFAALDFDSAFMFSHEQFDNSQSGSETDDATVKDLTEL